MARFALTYDRSSFRPVIRLAAKWLTAGFAWQDRTEMQFTATLERSTSHEQ
jgi:hypothetical protein